jgi:hypothetical protein
MHISSHNDTSPSTYKPRSLNLTARKNRKHFLENLAKNDNHKVRITKNQKLSMVLSAMGYAKELEGQTEGSLFIKIGANLSKMQGKIMLYL